MKTVNPRSLALAAALSAIAMTATPAWADPFEFSTGNPDGRIATLSRLASGATIQTETADDFVLGQATQLTQASFIGLIPLGAPVSSVSQVEIEFYHVFPGDSANPPSGHVPTRDNSPGDVEIDSATRDSADGSLSFSVSVLNPSYTASNSVVNGIHPLPGVFTGGEGPVTGQEVLITVNFAVPVELDADHYFFRPEALLGSGNFLWLSAAKPIAAPGTPFAPDLQTWIRNDDLAPDWLRIGTDITGQGPFNAAFTLTGDVVAVPEPSTYALMLLGLAAIGAAGQRRAHLAGRSTLSK
jgi:PEP-CTERM motif